MKKYLTTGIIFLAVVTGLGTAASAQVAGGYQSAAKDDARVAAAAEFAVSKRVETHTEQEGLTLASIDKAETQVVAGTNFRLCLTVRLEDESQQVEAVVFQNLKQAYSLTSWMPKDCAGKSPDKTGGIAKTPPPAGTKATANCTGEQLSFSEGDGDADMGGKRYGKYLFTNISSKPCRLSGFPQFSALDKTGKIMRSIGVKYDNDFPGADTDGNGKNSKPAVVMLEPKQSAVFRIFYNDGMALDHKKPFPVSAKVKVKAPNTTREFVIKSEINACCGVEVSSISGESPQ